MSPDNSEEIRRPTMKFSAYNIINNINLNKLEVPQHALLGSPLLKQSMLPKLAPPDVISISKR
jgi:hypothetical protein